jgi:hypothetical protein
MGKVKFITTISSKAPLLGEDTAVFKASRLDITGFIGYFFEA